MAQADQKPSTPRLDFPLPLLQAVEWVTSRGFDRAEVWNEFERALIWDHIHAWDPRRAHFEALDPYLREFCQAGTSPADTDVITHRGRIRGSTWLQWLVDRSLNRETGTIARAFEGRRPHVEVFEPVLEGADVQFVHSIVSAQRKDHATQPAAAAASLAAAALTLPVALTEQPAEAALPPETAASIAATDLVVGSSTSEAPNLVEEPAVDQFRTGAAGRPTAKHVILDEFERMLGAEEVEPAEGRLTKFAQDIMAPWWETRRLASKGPSVKPGTIVNMLREPWRKALAAKRTKSPS
jgi:hypothetical protein